MPRIGTSIDTGDELLPGAESGNEERNVFRVSFSGSAKAFLKFDCGNGCATL